MGSQRALRDGPQRTHRRSASASSVLRTVLDHGPIARSTIARRTGLSPAAVTGHTAELTELGLLRELPEVGGAIGRPHVPVDLDTAHHVIGGIHLAVHFATVALLDVRGRVLVQRVIPHPSLDPVTVLLGAADALLELGRPHGIGVATGGWVDERTGSIIDHPLLGWRDVPARDLLTGHTGLAVAVDSHSRALVHAERLLGQTRARASVVQLFAGNVVDAAFATGDTVHHGPRSAAGAVAHLPVDDSTEPCDCGRTGCLQATVSEQTVARKAGLPFTELLDLAKKGDANSIALFHERARLLGQAAALLLDVLNPEILIVVDQSVHHVPGCLSALREEVDVRSWICDDAEKVVVPSSFSGRELATAGGAVLLNALYQDPLSTSLRRTS
ncbi:ROK family transcriptional regulator [Amycolatopsis xylanica]|uniref:ROK family transcriptional regulator n=1 Tax=Amycolatopsis xylanica TaxID=589385 RepID=UPI000B8A0533|nr:ROK family transcriptional regulator [Amycolatopsis xylanica]